MRFGLKRDAAGDERITCGVNVRNFKVERAPKPFGTRFFRTAQHQTHVACREKGHRWRRVEQMLHTQSITIKGHALFKVIHGQSDLADVTQCKASIVRIHDAMLNGVERWKLL